MRHFLGLFFLFTLPLLGQVEYKNTTIDSGYAISSSVSIGSPAIKGLSKSLVGVQIPTGLDSDSLTFQVSEDNSTFYNLFYEDAELGFKADSLRYISISPDKIKNFKYVKIRAGTSFAPDSQAVDITLRLKIIE